MTKNRLFFVVVWNIEYVRICIYLRRYGRRKLLHAMQYAVISDYTYEYEPIFEITWVLYIT